MRVLFSGIRELRKMVNVVLHYGYKMEVPIIKLAFIRQRSVLEIWTITSQEAKLCYHLW